jgi:hypothetical protein
VLVAEVCTDSVDAALGRAAFKTWYLFAHMLGPA